MERSDEADRGAAPLWLKLVATGLVSVAVAMGSAGLLSWRDLGVIDSRIGVLERRTDGLERRLEQSDDTVSVLAAQANTNSIHRMEHEKSAERWIDQIVQNTKEIQNLQRNTNARPDPFTGTMGRELEERVQRQINELKRR